MSLLAFLGFLNSWPVMIGMAVGLLALIGVFIYLRSADDEDE